ncbi:hypothetical protein STEG23_013207 [Scotinomys teguina]
MQNDDIQPDAQTGPLPSFEDLAKRNNSWWASCLRCISHEEVESPPFTMQCQPSYSKHILPLFSEKMNSNDPKPSCSKTPEEELEESNEMDVKSKRVKKDLQVSYNQCLNSLSASEQITNMFVPSQVLARVEERPPGQLQSVFKQLVSIRTAVHHNPDGEPLGSEVEHLRRHPRPPVPNSPGKINVGYCTGSSLFQKAVHHNPDGEPLGSEVEHLRRHPRPPVPNSPGKINVGYCTGSSLFQKGSHQKTSKSEKTPDREPEKRNETDVKSNKDDYELECY